MTKRIFKNTILVAFIVLAAALLLTMGVLYDNFGRQYAAALKNETICVAEAMDTMDGSYADYFSKLSTRLGNGIRITLVDADGTVRYDSAANPETMENHKNREEIAAALATGIGESRRYSSTLAQETNYYALRLGDGMVLRLAGTHASVWALLVSLIPAILVILALTLILASVLASGLSKKLTRPLETLDLEHPEEAEAYDELSPLLGRLSQQNRQIAEQMESLRQRQREFETITENMEEGLVVVDRNADLLLCNASAKRLFGTAPEDGQSVLALSRSAPFRAAVEAALQGRHDEQTLTIVGRKYQLVANPVQETGQTAGAVLMLLDVTEREAREQLRREFTANVSHELKTPLTSISGFAEIIKNDLASPEDIPRFAGNIYTESQRLIALVSDIIRLSQLDENSGLGEKVPVDLSPIVDACVDGLRPAAEKRRVTFERRTEHVQVLGVASVLDEMVYNLIDNAVKYNREGGTVSVTLDAEEDAAVLTVRDTGIGIPAEDQDRIFERFYRVDKSRSHRIGGTGLGLSIVKHGAMFHGAALAVSSRAGEGSVFTLRFPRV